MAQISAAYTGAWFRCDYGSNPAVTTYAMRVPGGVIVRTRERSEHADVVTGTSVFVPCSVVDADQWMLAASSEFASIARL